MSKSFFRLVCVFFILQSATIVFAQDSKVDLKKAIADFFGPESAVSLRYRNEHKLNGATSKDQFQYKIDLKMKFQITPDGKLLLKSRALTGAKFDSDYDETGVGPNKVDPTFDLSLRQIYLDYSPSKNWNLQTGAMPTVPSTITNGKTVLSLDGDGWVDGARASYSNLTTWADRIAVTVGQVDEYTHTNFYNRGLGSPNFIQLHVQGNLAKRFRYLLEGTHFEGDEFVRSVMEVALKDLVGFVDAVVIEDLVKLGGDDTQQGFSASLKKAISDWRLTGSYSYKAPYISQLGPKHMMLEDVYRQGHQVSVRIEKVRNWGTPYVFVTKTVAGAKFGSNQGLRVEGGVKVNLFPKKK